jgi:hypothetical protein
VFPNLPTSGNIPLCGSAGMILDETLQDRRDSNFSHFVLFKGGENEVLATAKLQSDGARDSD